MLFSGIIIVILVLLYCAVPNKLGPKRDAFRVRYFAGVYPDKAEKLQQDMQNRQRDIAPLREKGVRWEKMFRADERAVRAEMERLRAKQ